MAKNFPKINSQIFVNFLNNWLKTFFFFQKFSKNKFSDFCQTSLTIDCKPFLKDKQSAAAVQIISPIRANTQL